MGYTVATLFNSRQRQATLHELFVPAPVDDLRRFSKDYLFLDPRLEGKCKYGYGRETPYLFCGNDVQTDSSYCPGHHAICWTEPKQRTSVVPSYRNFVVRV